MSEQRSIRVDSRLWEAFGDALDGESRPEALRRFMRETVEADFIANYEGEER